MTKLRLKLEEIHLELEQSKEKIKLKDAEITKYKEIKTSQGCLKMELKIKQLEANMSEKDREKEEIKMLYSLDNQINLIFPKHHPTLAKAMNMILIAENLSQNKQ